MASATKTMIECWDGDEYDAEQLEKAHGSVKSATGVTVYLTADAYLSHDPQMEAIYEAYGVDAAGNRYHIAWEITNPGDDDESNACDWDKPYRVEVYETA